MLIGIFGGFLVLILQAAGSYFEEKSAANRAGELTRSLEASEAKINRALPKMVDEETRFDSVKAGPFSFDFGYTLVQSDTVKYDLPLLGRKLVATSCGEPSLQAWLRRGVKLGYTYWYNDGKTILYSKTVELKDCE